MQVRNFSRIPFLSLLQQQQGEGKSPLREGKIQGRESEEQQVVGLLSRAGHWLFSLPALLGLDLGGCQTALTLPSLGTRKKSRFPRSHCCPVSPSPDTGGSLPTLRPDNFKDSRAEGGVHERGSRSWHCDSAFVRQANNCFLSSPHPQGLSMEQHRQGSRRDFREGLRRDKNSPGFRVEL